MPSLPCCTTSGIPPTADAMIGVSTIIASRSTEPKASCIDGSTNTSEWLITSLISLMGNNPWKNIGKFSLRAISFIQSKSLPAPITRRLTPGIQYLDFLLDISLMASTKVSMPFLFSTAPAKVMAKVLVFAYLRGASNTSIQEGMTRIFFSITPFLTNSSLT